MFQLIEFAATFEHTFRSTSHGLCATYRMCCASSNAVHVPSFYASTEASQTRNTHPDDVGSEHGCAESRTHGTHSQFCDVGGDEADIEYRVESESIAIDEVDRIICGVSV